MALPERFGGGGDGSEKPAADEKPQPTRDEKVAAALEAESGDQEAEDANAAPGEEKAAVSEGDDDSAGLFGAAAEEDEGGSDESDSDDPLFDSEDEGSDDSGDKPKSVSQKAFKARLNKLIGQRNDARGALEAADDRSAELTSQVTELTQLMGGIHEQYDGYANPLEQAKFDMAMLDAFEELAKTDPIVAQAGEKILEALGNDPKAPKASRSSNDVSEQNDDTTHAEIDPSVAELLADKRLERVGESLPSTLPSFQKLVGEVLEDIPLGEVDREVVREVAKDIISEYGFTEAQVYAPKKVEDKGTVKPNTKASQGRAGMKAQTKEEAKEADEKRVKSYKNIHEMRADRENRISELLGSL